MSDIYLDQIVTLDVEMTPGLIQIESRTQGCSCCSVAVQAHGRDEVLRVLNVHLDKLQIEIDRVLQLRERVQEVK